MVSDGLINCFIGMFAGSVHFWMISCQHLEFSASDMSKGLPELEYEKLVLVTVDFIW